MLLNMKKITVTTFLVVYLITQLSILNVQSHDSRDVSKKKKNTTRLYGARNAYDGQIPYAAFHILRRNSPSIVTCSASLIHPRWALLAAHCIARSPSARSNLIVAGKANVNAYMAARNRMSIFTDIHERQFDLQERRGVQIFSHPNYTRSGYHDVGLILLNRPFLINDRVSIVHLSRVPMEREQTCTLAGYGVAERNQRRNILQYIDNMPARPASQCRFSRNKDVVCLVDTSRGICQGDSGGPILCSQEGNLDNIPIQHGVASYALVRSGSSGCGVGVVEQYYTDIYRNINWISSIVFQIGRIKL